MCRVQGGMTLQAWRVGVSTLLLTLCNWGSPPPQLEVKFTHSHTCTHNLSLWWRLASASTSATKEFSPKPWAWRIVGKLWCGPKWTQILLALQRFESLNGTPLHQGVRMPWAILACKALESSQVMGTFPSLGCLISTLILVEWLILRWREHFLSIYHLPPNMSRSALEGGGRASVAGRDNGDGRCDVALLVRCQHCHQNSTLTLSSTVRLTSIYYQVLGYPDLLIALSEIIIGLVKKIWSLAQGTVWGWRLLEVRLVLDNLTKSTFI